LTAKFNRNHQWSLLHLSFLSDQTFICTTNVLLMLKMWNLL